MTDPILAPIAADLLWRSLTDVARFLLRVDSDSSDHRARVSGVAAPSGALADALEVAGQRLTEPPAMAPELGGERLRGFLESPDARAIVRQIYASALADSSVEHLEDQFNAELMLWTGLGYEAATTHGSRLFRSFVAVCQEALDQAIESNVLAAHEASSKRRHKLLTERLGNIEQHVEALHDRRKASHEEILKFERAYRKQVADRESRIIPPNLDRNVKVPIDDLYVPPRLLREGVQQKGIEPLSYAAFIDELDRTVVLGNPGAGKSTLAIKLCHDLATGTTKGAYRDMDVTPILVILRDYGASRKTNNSSILDFIENTAHTRYQLPEVPRGAFDYVLQCGRALVIFDGLDELLDSSYRQVVSADVETFAALYSATPILVTSRRIGYEQAPLNPVTFEAYGMMEFDSDEVEAYARNWFAIDSDLSREDTETKVAGFVRESEIVPDLRANPLMLGLMCNLYGGANYIPANRPDVYEKCAMMLFERWDRSRGITVELPFESRLRPAMQHLAHWIYLDESLQSGVTREQLITEATAYLFPRQFDDENIAREAAGQFVDVCKGRAWVFTDTGLTPSNEPLFQFTHRTFLEYFSAGYLARKYRAPAELIDALVPRIARGEWDVVSQLAVQIKTRYVEDAEDEMIGELISRAGNESSDIRINLLFFAVRSLEFLVPSPRCVDQVVTVSVTEALKVAAARGLEVVNGNFRLVDPSDTAAQLMPALGVAGKETWSTVVKGIERTVENAIREDDGRIAILGCELAHHLETVARDHVERVGQQERYWQLHRCGINIIEALGNRVSELALEDPLLRVDAVVTGLLPARVMVERDGIQSLFAPRPLRVFPGAVAMPVVGAAAVGAISQEDSWYWWPRRPALVALLSELGQLLGEHPPPWDIRSQMGLQPWLWRADYDIVALSDGAARFALAVITAVGIERSDDSALRPPTEIPKWSAMVELAQARDRNEVSSSLAELFSSLGDADAAMMRRWCLGEINFTTAAESVPG